MDMISEGFHLFGKSKLNLRYLIIYKCRFESRTAANPGAVEIKRARKRSDGKCDYESCNVDCSLFVPGATLYLHDIFLTPTFGLRVKFLNKNAKFEFCEPGSDVPVHSELEI